MKYVHTGLHTYTDVHTVLQNSSDRGNPPWVSWVWAATGQQPLAMLRIGGGATPTLGVPDL